MHEAFYAILLQVLPYMGTLHFDKIMEDAIREHPFYNLEEYGEFGGFNGIEDPMQATISLIYFAIAAVSPILQWYLKHRILKTLTVSNTHSQMSKRSSNMFLK
ncbi:hypothetical protein COOONC_26141, partial [Cooperia oncophora]